MSSSSSSSTTTAATAATVPENDGSSLIPPPYPTGRTVPFPYDRPYDVQLDLMDAMLTALGPTPSDDGSGNGVGGRNGRGRIILLESPTGTGKSLSLGCAALAWLRHAEASDLAAAATSDAPAVVDDDDDDGKVEGASSSDAGGQLDWVDAWAPASAGREEEKLKKDDVESRRRVRTHRDELEKVLGAVRRKIEGNEGGHGADDGKEKKRAKAAAMRSARGRVAGEAVRLARENFAQQADRRRRRRRPPRVRRADGVDEDEEEDFCVDEYNSDDNAEDETDSSCSSSSDKEEDEVAKRVRPANTTTTSRGGAVGRSQPPPDAAALLDGGALDGSSSSTPADADADADAARRNKRAFSSPSSTEAEAATVGGVAPGSGVRKVIYAARTHSQLSQFVSELRRIPTDRSVRAVALGGRKLLCGNPDVLGSEEKYRSEAAVNERCLDLQKGKKKTTMKSGVVRRRDRQKKGGLPSPVSVADGDGIGEKRKRGAVGAEDGKEGKEKGGGTGCPLLRDREAAVSTLALHALAHPTDVEDLSAMGRASGACAYYAARESLPAAEIVAVPYSTLLSPQARKAVGLSLRGSLVVIDEAHNVPEALRSLSTRRIDLPTVVAASEQLDGYVARYSQRLAGRNLFYLGQLRKCLEGVRGYLQRGGPPPPPPSAASRPSSTATTARSSAVMMTTNELLFALGLDNVNLFKVDRYLARSRLAQKLLGFANFVSNEEGDSRDDNDGGSGREFVSKHVSAMSTVQEFLACLNSDESVGKIVAEWPSEKEGGADHQSTTASASSSTRASSSSAVRHPTLRYVLFHPSSKFGDVVREAHAVVLAGGTLRPFAHVASELLGGGGGPARDADGSLLEAAARADEAVSRGESESGGGGGRRSVSYLSSPSSSNLSAFSCGHVVDRSHVYLSCLSTGPTSTKLDFRHKFRSSDAVCDELGRTLVNLVNVAPKGFIVFLPSYKYEAHLVRRWRKTGVLDRMGRKKVVHREPKSARDVDRALASYSKDAAAAGGGAILFCVIGGKMSEGINFADDMARCVLVVGLPYPDIGDPELVEKMAALDREVTGRGANRGGGITGRSYYQNLCMRAVNQSVGRAIRHEDDYAAILLADFRYAEDTKIWSGLPRWLRGEHANKPPPRKKADFGSAICGLSRFFRERRPEA